MFGDNHTLPHFPWVKNVLAVTFEKEKEIKSKFRPFPIEYRNQPLYTLNQLKIITNIKAKSFNEECLNIENK